MLVSLIAAMTPDRVIGTGQGIPWHLPRDSAHFRSYTRGKAMLLGRRTYEEMDGWFVDQRPIILTRQLDYEVSHGGTAVASVGEAVEVARNWGCEELVVSGGAQVYAAALPEVSLLVLTVVQATVKGAAVFPDFQAQGNWSCERREPHGADAENAHALEFQWWRRVGGRG